MYNARNYLFITLCLLMINLFHTPLPSAEASSDPKELKRLEKENKELNELTEKLKQRLQSLEPTNPINIQDPPWAELHFPSKTVPISEVIEKGAEIPFKKIVDKPDYIRPAYDELWHSTFGRWSYLPYRIHYALHRLFTNYDIGLSNWYDFEHNMGITIPMYQSDEALNLYIVTFQMQVTNIFTKGNQVVVVGKPKRTGVQVVTITTKDINPVNIDDNLLVQLVTPEGYEIDYSLISYVQPDFWEKQGK